MPEKLELHRKRKTASKNDALGCVCLFHLVNLSASIDVVGGGGRVGLLTTPDSPEGLNACDWLGFGFVCAVPDSLPVNCNLEHLNHCRKL
jgi:hypothetical protein